MPIIIHNIENLYNTTDIKILNPKTNKYVLVRGNIGIELTDKIVEAVIKLKNTYRKQQENIELVDLKNKLTQISNEPSIVRKYKKDILNDEKIKKNKIKVINNEIQRIIKESKTQDKYEYSNFLKGKRAFGFKRKLNRIDRHEELVIERRLNLTNALKNVELELRSDSVLCTDYIHSRGKNTKYNNIPTIVRRMCEMKYLFDYRIDIRSFHTFVPRNFNWFKFR